MRRAARRDTAEELIVQALRIAGCKVRRLSGPGIPDLLVSKRGTEQNYLLEVKNPGCEDDLTDEQIEFMLEWVGQVNVVTTPEEALAVIGSL